jgi:site-specific DNA-cytosine methylase
MGKPMECGVEYIRCKLPNAFVFEKARALSYRRHKHLFDNILETLTDCGGTNFYDVRWKVLNLKDHGVPQSRPRLFIVGIMRTKLKAPFRWPRKCATCTPITEILGLRRGNATKPDLSRLSDSAARRISECMQKILSKGGDPLAETWFIDCTTNPPYNVRKDICPHLTKSRAKFGGFYVSNRGSMLTTCQMLGLQGISPGRILAPDGVSEGQFASAIGNASTVPVLAKIALSLCKSLDYVPGSANVAPTSS